MTKVCYVSPLSIHSYRLVEAFFNRGYKVSLITDSSYWVAPMIKFAPVHTLTTLNRANVLWRFIPNTTSILTILKRINPDFVHLHVEYHYTPAIISAGFPFVFSSWGAEVLQLLPSNIIFRSMAKVAAVKAHAITVDAQCLKEIWIELGIPESKIHVIPFGVDTTIFNRRVDAQSVREKLRIDKKDTVIISTRPFYNDHYNIECLIKAIPSITKASDNVKFIIKGSGPLEKYLKNLAKKLGVARYIRFVGMIPYSEMPQLLSAADIYVSTCFVDSTSVSLLEAMACGLAPMVTDIPGNREWIEDGVNGFLYPPRNNTILAEKIVNMAENPKLREYFGKRCANTIKRRATWESCVSRMQAIYERLAKR